MRSTPRSTSASGRRRSGGWNRSSIGEVRWSMSTSYLSSWVWIELIYWVSREPVLTSEAIASRIPSNPSPEIKIEETFAHDEAQAAVPVHEIPTALT